MIPKIYLVNDSTCKLFRHPEWNYRTLEDVLSKVALPGSTLAKARIPIWNGHEFEILDAIVEPDPKLSFHGGHWEGGMTFYGPIDPRMIEEDVAGATIAYPNEDGTAWLFAHCDNDAMVDYEKELSAAVVGEFAKAIDSAQIKVNEATNSTVKTLAVNKHRSLVSFRNEVISAIRIWARNLHIGWQEQNPHDAHLHTPILGVINKVALNWQTNNPTVYSEVSSAVAVIIKGLAKPHNYETRWDQMARLKAETEAAENDGENESEIED